LLAGLAARWAGVPCRVYTLRGLRFETKTGVMRALMKLLEKLACSCAHLVLCVSESVRKKAVEQVVVEEKRTVVLGCGSSNGVDPSRFGSTDERRQRAQELRQQLGIPEDSPVIGFVGRLNRDKGVPELVRAFARLRIPYRNVHLLLLGDFEIL